MSSDSSTTVDPFAPTALEEETELRALAQALKLAQGFKLIFARCNQPQQRKKLVAALREMLGDFDIQEVDFTEPIVHLLDELHGYAAKDRPQALFVSGLEYSLPAAAEAHKTSFVANLNASRNSFPEIIPCPLVLWIPEYALNAIMLGAPDFYSIRSGTYFFAASAGDTHEIAYALTSGTDWMTLSLTLAEKQERIQAIKSLLSDYELLPPEKRNLQAEWRLHFRLGRLLHSLGSFDCAEEHFKQLRSIAKEAGDKVGENLAFLNLGNVYSERGKWAEAEVAFKQSVEGFRAIRDSSNEAIALNNLGNVYNNQQQWEEAGQMYQQAIKLSHEVNDKSIEVLALSNMANTLTWQHRFSEAEQLYQQSLNIVREIKYRYGECSYLNNLGLLYAQQGRFVEAHQSFQQSLDIAQELGDYIAKANAFGNLALLKYQQGDIKSAIELMKQSVDMLRNTQDLRINKAKALLEKWEQEVEEQVKG